MGGDLGGFWGALFLVVADANAVEIVGELQARAGFAAGTAQALAQAGEHIGDIANLAGEFSPGAADVE